MMTETEYLDFDDPAPLLPEDISMPDFSKSGLLSIPFNEYLASPNINCSALKLIAKSPLHYKASLEQPREQTKAMLIGSAVHSAVLEPDMFNDVYVIEPSFNKRTKEGKFLYAAFIENNVGKIELSHDDYALVQAIAESVRNHPTVSRLLESGAAERSLFTNLMGVPTKARYDWYRENAGIIVDLKTCQDASQGAFSRAIATYGYDIQDAFYTDCGLSAGLPVRAFVFVCVETIYPHAVAVYELDARSRDIGRIKYQRALETYIQCQETDTYPGYPVNIMPIGLPGWEINKYGELQ